MVNTFVSFNGTFREICGNKKVCGVVFSHYGNMLYSLVTDNGFRGSDVDHDDVNEIFLVVVDGTLKVVL